MLYADTKHIQTEVPTEQHRALKRFCVDHDLTLTILLSQMVAEWIAKHITLKEVTHGEKEND